MRTGDGPTEDAGGATRDDENVIRLPRDWLGPPEELIPIGPAARARAAQLESGAPPPAADAFWSEDAAALHDAVQAPQNSDGTPANPPVGLVAPVAGQWQFHLSRWAVLRRVRASWALLAVVAVALAVLAAIGFGEQPRTGVTARQSDGVREAVSTPAPKTSMAAAASLLAQRATASRHRVRRRASASRARTHARQSPAHRPSARHPAAPIRHPTATSAAAVVHASTPSQTSGGASTGSTASQNSVPATTTTPASETASKPSAGGSSSAPPPGPTGIGSMTGGCTVRCS